MNFIKSLLTIVAFILLPATAFAGVGTDIIVEPELSAEERLNNAWTGQSWGNIRHDLEYDGYNYTRAMRRAGTETHSRVCSHAITSEGAAWFTANEGLDETLDPQNPQVKIVMKNGEIVEGTADQLEAWYNKCVTNEGLPELTVSQPKRNPDES